MEIHSFMGHDYKDVMALLDLYNMVIPPDELYDNNISKYEKSGDSLLLTHAAKVILMNAIKRGINDGLL